jgi:beta-lactamase regulating signal transducer with metallopeptidase domain
MLAIAWMLTYLLHSTLLLGLAWIASKPLSRWSVAAEETVWKLALVGALFTASLQLAAGWQPLAGRWNLAAPAPAATISVNTAREATPAVETPAATLRASLPARLPVAEPAAAASALPRLSASTVVLALWALGALVLLAAFGRSLLRLGRRLQSRPRVVGGTLHGQLRGLAAEAGLAGGAVRLSCSSRVPVPVALGVLRPEICVPPRALAGLTDEQQEGMLAHELAHLARRDPFWLLLGQGIASVLFFQPLNWVARRRLREISEMLSDEWAVARTGRPLSLAACLAEVAGWSVGTPSLPVPGMADQPSSLGRRIRRLLDSTRSPENSARRAWLAAAMAVLVIAVAAAAPAISAARPEPPPAQAPAALAPTAPIDVKDATDTPTHPAVSEPEERAASRADQEHPGMKARHGDEDEPETDAADSDDDPMIAGALDALDAGDNNLIQGALAGAGLETLTADHAQSVEQQEKMTRLMAKMNQRLKSRIDQIAREMAAEATRRMPTPEMLRMTEEMAKLGEQMRPSAKEMARVQAQMAEEMKKLQAENVKMTLSAEDRERIARQAREMAAMATKLKPTEEQRRRMDELRAELNRESAKMGEQFQAQNRDQIEKLQREVREEVERETQGMRDEMRRAMDERKVIERQARKDRDRQKRERRDTKPESDDDHDGDAKPPGR